MPAEPTIGEIALFAFGSGRTMRGWLPCFGQLLPINTNQALFSLLGIYFGGDGRVNFALPDLRGRTPVGAALSGGPNGLSAYQLGARGGATNVTLMPPEMPMHAHTLMGTSNPADAASIVDAIYANVAAVPPAVPTAPPLYGPASNLTNFDPGTMLPSGGSGAHANMQPSIGLCFMIATQGIYPSRT